MSISPVRVRFAPSPTGFLHLGGARTALFNWLFARHMGGTFVLRIEDTDRERSTRESIDIILNAMSWLGMTWDEGPHYQTERLNHYHEHLKLLVDSGQAYRCTCTPEELAERRQKAKLETGKMQYDRRCLGRYQTDPEEPFVWRFLSPDKGKTVVDDLVRGQVVFSNDETDDLVLMRPDGLPTYNFAVVVDDASMQISHVIRGEDHLTNTPRQIQLYRAMQLPVPQFAHLPLIKGLSKRIGSASIQHYQKLGYLPQGMVNYLARLGWSHGDQELFTMEELIEHFGLESVGKASGAFNPEKMEWVNAQHIQSDPLAEVGKHLLPFLAERGIQTEVNDHLESIVMALRPRSKTLVDMADRTMMFYRRCPPDAKAAKILAKPDSANILRHFHQKLVATEEPWTQEVMEEALKSLALELEAKMGAIAQPARAAITGSTVSPGMFEVLSILGKTETLERLETTLQDLGTPQSP